ncbi:hemerythrin domain-containing protein [Adhaeretor mobilis]|uniref:Hemerythrin-like domain-containing protein n=1 Tax=Adhaeretor mobilis TaxID=1930276 RepID=A0A517MY68_9BACT|nr:hemerythrin domain-containing protein [Adhaeretor mobilis]QDS99829.1 hypothetical protein HG15A2_31600 [Adhaeretor mobilis]
MQAIDSRSQASATWMEHQILDHVKQALRVTLDWKVPAVGMPRKLSSLQFTMKSFQRHLQRVMEMEERDGYMTIVADSKPNMEVRIEHLRRDHGLFREWMEELAPEIESLSEFQEEEFDGLCQRIGEMLDSIDRHDADEIELLQETLLFDEGGEG